jgi:hypothetical protein
MWLWSDQSGTLTLNTNKGEGEGKQKNYSYVVELRIWSAMETEGKSEKEGEKVSFPNRLYAR